MNLARRPLLALYDLGVRAGLLRYRRRWRLSPADWDIHYADGRLDYYGQFWQFHRLEVLIGTIRAFPRKPRVLDIGCGSGTLRARIHDDYLAEYVGLDISEVAISAAKAQNFPKSRFIVGDRPGPGDGPFDIIAFTDMLFYVDDRTALFDALKPQMAPDGWLVNVMYRHHGDTALMRELARHFTLIDGINLKRNVAPKHKWNISAYGLQDVDAAAIRGTVLADSVRLGPA
ncbi:MAG: class I SAM-dependent methyltransferase [Phenylobacterium sp.]